MMGIAPRVRVRLVHRGRSVPRGLLKLAVGLLLVATAVAIPFVVHALGGGLLLLLLCVLPGVWLVDWGAPIVLDGVTDLYSRWAWREVRSGRAMELDDHGIRYTAALGLGRRQAHPEPDLVFSWTSVVAARFRPAPADSWWFCLDLAQSAWTREQTLAALDAGAGVPEGSDLGEATARRRLAENLRDFGTPLAMNLEICPGARPRRLDRALQRWTDGRLSFRSPEPPWWRPPRFPLAWAQPSLRRIFTASAVGTSHRAPPQTSCVVGGWLVGVKHPARLVVAEVLALAEDGYVKVVADNDGYTLHRGPADPATLWPDRAEVLAGLFHGGDPVRLARPALPPLLPPDGPISANRMSTAVSVAGERYGFVSRLRWLVLAGAILGLGAALAFAAAELWAPSSLLAVGTGLLATAWLQTPVRLSRAARAERDRLLQLWEGLRHAGDATDPALLPWAFLLLTREELTAWWLRVRPVSDQPRWLTWRPTRAGVWPGLMTDDGLEGLARALAHRTGP